VSEPATLQMRLAHSAEKSRESEFTFEQVFLILPPSESSHAEQKNQAYLSVPSCPAHISEATFLAMLAMKLVSIDFTK
jgi:hypothetical protein